MGDPVEGLLGTQGRRHGIPGLGVRQRLKAGRIEGSPTVSPLAMCEWVEEGHCGRPAREEEATGFAWVGSLSPQSQFA